MKFLKKFESFDSEVTAEEIYDNLQRNCPKYLEILRSCYNNDAPLPDKSDEYEVFKYYQTLPMLYRGSRIDTEDIEYVEPRKNRRSKDTNQGVSDEIDDKFESSHGIRPRSEGVFATFNSDVASHYGTRHLFFPIGDFKYIWSTKIDDLFEELRKPKGKKYSWYLWEVDEGYRESVLNDRSMELYDEISPHGYKDIKSGEIVMADEIEQFYEEFTEEMNILMADAKEEWMNSLIDGYKINEDFCDVAGLNNEVTFICDAYYAVEVRFLDKLKKMIYELDIDIVD